MNNRSRHDTVLTHTAKYDTGYCTVSLDTVVGTRTVLSLPEYGEQPRTLLHAVQSTGTRLAACGGDRVHLTLRLHGLGRTVYLRVGR